MGSYPYEQRDFSGSAELYTVEYRLFQYCLHWKCPYHGHSLISLDIWDIYPIWKADLRLCLTSPMYLQAQHKHRTQIYCCGTQQSSTSMFTRPYIRKILCFQCQQRWWGKGCFQIWLDSPPTHATTSQAVCKVDLFHSGRLRTSYATQLWWLEATKKAS